MSQCHRKAKATATPGFSFQFLMQPLLPTLIVGFPLQSLLQGYDKNHVSL